MSVCTKCGQPKELCMCSQLLMAEQKVIVETDKRRFNKPITLIKGINFEDLGLEARKDLLTSLKKELACGGTYDKEHNWIELQGSHLDDLKRILVNKGFNVEGYEEKQ